MVGKMFVLTLKQCIYIDPESPCQSCLHRGLVLSCGMKIFGREKQTRIELRGDHERGLQSQISLTRAVPTIGLSRLTSRESGYIDYFLSSSLLERPLLSRPWPGLSSFSVIKARLASMLLFEESKPLQNAVFALSSSKTTGNPSIALTYLARCYRLLRQAIDASALVDVLYTCWLLIRATVLIEASVEITSTHIFGLWKVLHTICQAPGDLDPAELIRMELSWIDALDWYWYRVLEINHSGSQTEFCAAVERTFCELRQYPTESTIPSNSDEFRITEASRTTRIVNSFFQHYMAVYFKRLANPSQKYVSAQEVACSLLPLLEQYKSLIPRLEPSIAILVGADIHRTGVTHIVHSPLNRPDHPYDLTFQSIYCISIILHHSFHSPTLKSLPSEAMNAANYLCRVAALRPLLGPSQVLASIRDLFTAGLVLTAFSSPIGKLLTYPN